MTIMACRRYTISSRSAIPSLSLLLIIYLLSIYLSSTKTVYAEQRSTTTTTNSLQQSPPPPNNVQTTILPLSTKIPNDIPSNTETKINEVNNNGGDEWKLLDGEFSTNTNNKDDKQQTENNVSSNEQQSIISDASSAMAANYITKANYNPPTSNMASSSGANNGNSNAGNNSGGGWFGKILGKDKQSNNNDSNTAKNGPGQSSTGGAGRTFLPPPPPPPPMDMKSSDKASDGSSKQSTYGSQPWQQQQSYPPNNPNYNSYNNQNNNQYIDPNTYQALLYDLDESTLREMTLTHQIHNLSSHITTLTSESELLVSRVDVLTERLADSEANFHYVHNRNIELDANCTELQSVINKLQSDIKEHEATSNQLTEEKSKDASIIQELRNELRKVTDELESLACLVETSRFENEKIKYLDDLDKKKKKRKKKKKSFWMWLFGFGDSKLDDDDAISIKGSEQYEEERHRAAQELARTTLLHALQTERNNVDELESALNVLQRNNTAIMDVVSSRDELIVELNERVAVFEEDKMVLKAALRQLQMEIKEEAPKTQQLIEDLEGMKELEITLRDEMKQLIDDHEDEIDELEEEMNDMTNELNKTTNELEMIGLYVDQLEDRLATGAIARKELDVREKECERLEAKAKEYADEVEEYKSQVATLSKEQDDTKPLLEDLIKEREAARVKVDELGHQIDDLHQQINDWKLRVQEAERWNEEIKSESSRQLFLTVEEEKMNWQQQSQRAAEEKAKESEIVMAKERLEWAKSADEEYQGMLQQEKAVLERTLVNEWSTRLEQQRLELQSQYQQDIQYKLNEQLNTWEESKENEFSQRLMGEKSAWEAELAQAEKEKAASLEGEIDKAASKVYAQLEARDISFGVVEPSSLDQLKDIIGSTNDDKSTAETELTQDYHQEEESAHSWEEEEEEPLKMAPSQPQDSSLRPQKKEKSRQVPFRSLRKAFSQATGMHGLIRPSTAQLRQEQERVHKIQQGRGVIQDIASDTDTTYEQMSDSEDEDYQESESLPPPPLPEDRWQQY